MRKGGVLAGEKSDIRMDRRMQWLDRKPHVISL